MLYLRRQKQYRVYWGTIMKRYISAAFAAVLAVTASGCDNRNEPVTEVSTDDTSAGMVSNYTSQAFQAV